MSSVLGCKHVPKQFRLEYECKETGNYLVELCAECRTNEPTKFLLKEETI